MAALAVVATATWAPCAVAQELQVGVLINPKQRTPFEAVFARFSKESGIKVISINKTDADYKSSMPVWLLEGKETPDVVFWNASQRLFSFVDKDAVHPITKLWIDEKLDVNFSHVKSAVSLKGEVYALPISYYHWGLFYKKSLVEKFGGVPQNWEAFLAQCKRLREAGITPIGLGTKNNWPVAAWFDYLNLRINGLPFHQQLLAGGVSFHDPRVHAVLVEWKKMIDAKYFNGDQKQFDWHEILPFFYRDKIAYTLIGSFVSTTLATSVVDDIGFMPFPTISAKVPRYEEAPMDVLVIPKKAKHIKEAEVFLKFMARADVQSQLNESLGFLPPNKQSTTGQNPHIKAGASLLKQASGVAQYFDRDTVPAFEAKAVPILVEFSANANVDDAINQLELARKEVFGK